MVQLSRFFDKRHRVPVTITGTGKSADEQSITIYGKTYTQNVTGLYVYAGDTITFTNYGTTSTGHVRVDNEYILETYKKTGHANWCVPKDINAISVQFSQTTSVGSIRVTTS